MGPDTVTEADGALIHDSYTNPFIFPVVGMIGAVPVYAIEAYGNFERLRRFCADLEPRRRARFIREVSSPTPAVHGEG